MCNFLLKPMFILAVLVGTGLTLAAMFTPGWRQYSSTNGTSAGFDVGIITQSCGGASDVAECQDWWNNRPDWEKVVIVFISLALATELFMLAWSLLTFFAFFLPSLFYPLPFLAGAASVFLIVAIAVYGAKNRDVIYVPNSAGTFASQSNVGYSFWLSVGAMAAMVVATFIGCAAATISVLSPI